jgi:4-hydroxy-4-methyl-2-oxoglutarate aldolase
VGMPLTVCGLEIAPGDLLHGDLNGLIKVPETGRDKMPGLADEVRRDEKKVMDFIKSDDFTIDGMKDLFTH